MYYILELNNKENIFQKARVKSHTRKTKSGKLVNVKEYTDKRQKKVKKINPWIEKYGKYKLTRYPTQEEKIEDVKVDLSGDIDTHAVLIWKDKKTGKLIRAYTPEFMKRNAKVKWERMSTFSSSKIEEIKENSRNFLLKETDARKKQIAAIINIISHTGLRVGTTQVFRQTKNRGVSTLAPNNVEVKGTNVRFNFIGKSYQRNIAEIKDKILAKYIKELKKDNIKREFLFHHVEYKAILNFFHKIMKVDRNYKLKDMRTYIATDLAKNLLFSKKINLKGLSLIKKKKILKDTINEVSLEVSKKLNNTPGIAKASYIHPQVINAWTDSLGVEPELLKAITGDENYIPTLDDILQDIKYSYHDEDNYILDEKDLEYCDEYLLPDWLMEEEDDIEKSFEDELKYFLIEKALVKEHQRKTKSGKIATVKQYTDKRTKKQVAQKKGREKKVEVTNVKKVNNKENKTKKDSKEKKEKEDINDKQTEQPKSELSTNIEKVEKKLKHLNWIEENYKDVINEKKLQNKVSSIKRSLNALKQHIEKHLSSKELGNVKNDKILNDVAKKYNLTLSKELKNGFEFSFPKGLDEKTKNKQIKEITSLLKDSHQVESFTEKKKEGLINKIIRIIKNKFSKKQQENVSNENSSNEQKFSKPNTTKEDKYENVRAAHQKFSKEEFENEKEVVNPYKRYNWKIKGDKILTEDELKEYETKKERNKKQNVKQEKENLQHNKKLIKNKTKRGEWLHNVAKKHKEEKENLQHNKKLIKNKKVEKKKPVEKKKIVKKKTTKKPVVKKLIKKKIVKNPVKKKVVKKKVVKKK